MNKEDAKKLLQEVIDEMPEFLEKIEDKESLLYGELFAEDRLFDMDTLKAFIHNYNRFEKILTDYSHPISISYNPHDDMSVVIRDYDLCQVNEKAEYVTCTEEDVVVSHIKNCLDETKFKIKPTRDYILIQSHLIAGDDIGIEVYWKYKDPLVWFDEFVKQLDRLFVIKEWNNNRLHPRIPITIRPKQI